MFVEVVHELASLDVHVTLKSEFAGADGGAVMFTVGAGPQLPLSTVCCLVCVVHAGVKGQALESTVVTSMHVCSSVYVCVPQDVGIGAVGVQAEYCAGTIRHQSQPGVTSALSNHFWNSG